MSAAVDALFAQGVEAIQACGHRRDFRVLNGANARKRFCGTLVVAQLLDPEAPLGQDVREQVTLHVLSDAPTLELGDRILESNTVTWQVLSREQNPADVEAKYALKRMVRGKDANV
jgi:hypothetical protein